MLDKNVKMNKNYSYPTTISEGILTQMYVFLVLFTFFDFNHGKFISKNRKNIFFSTRNLYIWAKILSYIVVG